MNVPDVVYVHPKTGGKLYIGAHAAVIHLEGLQENKIFHIVNCKGSEGENLFEEDTRFKYIRFAVALWREAA